MTLARERQRFPTRNYPYGVCRMAARANAAPLSPNVLYRRVVGLDDAPRPMTADELALLDDPMGRILRSGEPFPLSLRAVLAAADRLDGGAALPNQLVFLAADGGHVPWSPETDDLQRAFRFVVARGSNDFPLLASSSTLADSSEDHAFLQVIGWDEAHEVFHYYERMQGTFTWAGQSHHALHEPTRGQGPFDSHVNGSLVMKELRAPWINWHAPQAGINAEAFEPGDPLCNDPLFTGRVTAERLETEIVRPGITRWNARRVREAVDAGGCWREVPIFLRQLLTDTSVNLASSETVSALVAQGMPVRPPLSFFVNRDLLFDTLALVPDDFAGEIEIAATDYGELLERFEVHRSDGQHTLPGDAHFAFVVPEPAFEDTDLTAALINAGLLSTRLATALAMVDFPNPVFSPWREALLRHVPAEVTGRASELDAAFLAAVTAAIDNASDTASAAGSPEREFVALWEEADLKGSARTRIGAYLNAASEKSADPAAIEGWFRLAEQRRRHFQHRKLAEFPLTMPRSNIPPHAPMLRMTAEAVVAPQT